MKTTKTIEITTETIAKLESKGFRRWTKSEKLDRLYINPEALGMQVEYRRSGSISHSEWDALIDCDQQLEHPCYRFVISHAEAGRILAGKYYIDLAGDGQLHVNTTSDFAEALEVLINAVIADALTVTETVEVEIEDTETITGKTTDETETTYEVGTIERDGCIYPVTHDEDGYHIDLGGAVGITDGMNFDSDADALEGIAAMLDAENEDNDNDERGTTMNITGKTIDGNYLSTERRSCKYYDAPTDERVTVTLWGKDYERTVHERRIWRNMGAHTLVARFVIIDGTNYEVA